MSPGEIITNLESALIKLDNADRYLAATKIAEAIEILKADFSPEPVSQSKLYHDND